MCQGDSLAMSPPGRKLPCSPVLKQTRVTDSLEGDRRTWRGFWAVCAAAARLQKWLQITARSFRGQHRGQPNGESFSIALLLFFLSFFSSSFLWGGKGGGWGPSPSGVIFYPQCMWGLIHLCYFKNKMSVQLWDVKSLNISKHRESCIFFSSMLTHPCDRF